MAHTTDLEDSSAEIVLCHTEIEVLRTLNTDLLEALEDALAILHRMIDEDIEVNYGFARLILEAKDKAQEAIRKAKS